MSEPLHAILGANGVIARELSRALPDGTRIRQVSRNPRAVHATDELMPATLLDAQAVSRAVEGAAVAYLVAGLRYDRRVWADEWPRLMRNVIDACARHRTRLLFFDNVYAYGLVKGTMTEDTPLRPSSGKGEVRAAIGRMLLDAMKDGRVEGMIVRAPDFYGPGALGAVNAMVIDRLKAGRTAQWPGDPNRQHTLVFTPDAGRAVATLAQSDSAWGKVWHVPVATEPITGSGFVRIACELLGRPYRLQAVPRWMLRLVGVFMPVVRENDEMMYQFEHDYRFDSSRIRAAYGLTGTPYRDGIAQTLAA